MRAVLIGSMIALSACSSIKTGGDDDSDNGSTVDAVSSSNGDGGGTSSVAGDCDVVYTDRRENNANDDYTENRTYYALFDIADAKGVQVKRCDWQPFGPQIPACSDTYTCTGSPPPQADCELGGDAQLVNGKLRVYCGGEYEFLIGTTMYEGGGRWTSVEVSTD